ncbi:MAG: peptidoglycan recognition family protein [Actinomyces sp.]|nr:peptidoglycan recognition family protein [Actinomyces sp.]
MTYIPAAHHGPTTNAPVSRIVIHSTCPDVGFPAASKAGRAVSTANYFASTSRPASAHYVVDIATTVQCLPENTVGYHAPPNSGSIGIEICSDGGSKGSFENPAHAYTTTQWLSPEVWPAVERAAILAREICHRHHIPIRRLSVAQVRAGERGICGHNEVSEAMTTPAPGSPGTDSSSRSKASPRKE